MTKWRPDLIDLRLIDQHTLDVLAAAARGSGGHSLTYPLPQLVAEQERRKKAEMDEPGAQVPQQPPNPAPKPSFNCLELIRLSDEELRLVVASAAKILERRESHPASPDEIARGYRIRQVEEFAERVWGDRSASLDFLGRPHLMLHMQTPRQVAERDEEGAEWVREILGRLLHGTGL